MRNTVNTPRLVAKGKGTSGNNSGSTSGSGSGSDGCGVTITESRITVQGDCALFQTRSVVIVNVGGCLYQTPGEWDAGIEVATCDALRACCESGSGSDSGAGGSEESICCECTQTGIQEDADGGNPFGVSFTSFPSVLCDGGSYTATFQDHFQDPGADTKINLSITNGTATIISSSGGTVSGDGTSSVSVNFGTNAERVLTLSFSIAVSGGCIAAVMEGGIFIGDGRTIVTWDVDECPPTTVATACCPNDLPATLTASFSSGPYAGETATLTWDGVGWRGATPGGGDVSVSCSGTGISDFYCEVNYDAAPPTTPPSQCNPFFLSVDDGVNQYTVS